MKNFQKCDQISVIFLSLSILLGLVTFLPGGLIPALIIKGYLVLTCILISFVSWLLGRLIEGVFHIPWTRVLVSCGALIFALFLSSVFSNTPYLAFFGEGFELGTFAMLGSLLLGLFLASTLFVTKDRIIIFLKCFYLVYVVLALFQIVHIIIPAHTTLGIFMNTVDTPVGMLSDFAILSGSILIMSMLSLQFSKVEKITKITLISGAILSLFFVILANIFVVWVLVGVSAIVTLIYTLVVNRLSDDRSFPFIAFGISLVALFFILANSLFGNTLSNLVHSTYVDVHPSFQASVHTALFSLKENPVFGSGPNRFLREWIVYRPSLVNTNILWDMPFSSGSSLMMTIAMLGGGLGILAVIGFILAFGYEIVRKLFSSNRVLEMNSPNSVLLFGLCMITFYFFLATIFFSPGLAVVVCMFLFVGIFLGALVGEGRIEERHFPFLKDARAGFFSILTIVVFLFLSAGTVYAATEHFVAIVFFEKSIALSKTGDIAGADALLAKAISLTDQPAFQRTRVAFAEQSIQKILSTPTGVSDSDSVKSELQNAISVGNTAARQAISLDSTDPVNYIAFGDLLRILVPLKVDGVVATAADAYQKAIKIAPSYPKTYLSLASLYYDAGDNTNARIYTQKALQQKQNYTDAYFLLAQIEVADGNTEKAIEKIQSATLLDPNNPDVYFELGLLRYNSGNFSDAVSAFKKTINLNNQYLNAWYYLALAEQKIGNIKDATEILTALHKRLPDNQEVNTALTNITTPVVVPPVKSTNTKQEKAKKLPLPTGSKTAQ